MKLAFSIYMFFFSITFTFSQNRILVYHETNGFRHSGAITSGITMFEDLGNEDGDWITDNSQDSSVFNTSNLEQYDVVIFLNTSGDNLLTGAERAAFENFIASGKGFIGIHAATDTYRDRSWPFYNELVGGIVQSSPNHTVNNFNADMELINSHPIVDFLGLVGTIWNKNEEYYYWQINGGNLSTDNTVLLEVESTGSNSYDQARPITWYKESLSYDDDNNQSTPDITLAGFRSFYTALGHNGSDYSGNSTFRTMLKNATIWAIGSTLSLIDNEFGNIKLLTNPVEHNVQFDLGNFSEELSINVYDISGKNQLSQMVNTKNMDVRIFEINTTNFEDGVYFFQFKTKSLEQTFKIVKR